MIFTASRGQAFSEPFTFKNEKGQLIAVPAGEYVLTLERGETVRQFRNLKRERGKIMWNMTANETKALEYSTMYFVLTFNGTEISRGVLRVQ